MNTLLSDHSKGFGGRYGVDKDNQDKNAVGYDHKESSELHCSQIGERFESGVV